MVSIKFFVDWNNDAVFSSTEDISTDIRRLSWTRGREAEQEATPPGTATVDLKDPAGDYSPHRSTSKWGAGNVTLNREVLAQAVYGGTTYGLFRGRIQSIRPQITAEEQRASIFCIDGMDELERKIFSAPIGGSATGGGDSSNGSAFYGVTIGSTDGIITNILTNSSWPVARRVGLTTNIGIALAQWWQYNQSAKEALDEVERHDGGLIFVNSSGNIQFISSTHFVEASAIASFNSSDIKGWDYEFSVRDLYNAARITAHKLVLDPAGSTALGGEVGSLVIAVLPNIDAGSTYVALIEFEYKTNSLVRVPQIGINGSGELALVSLGGTTIPVAQSSISGIAYAGSAMICRIVNNSAGTVTIGRPEGSTGGSTTETMRVSAAQALSELKSLSTYSDSSSIDAYQRRVYAADFPFFNDTNAQIFAERLVERQKRPKAGFASLSLESASTYLVTQILSREIGDRVRITVGDLGIRSRDYHIFQGEWEAVPGNALGLGAHLSVQWGLLESSGNTTGGGDVLVIGSTCADGPSTASFTRQISQSVGGFNLSIGFTAPLWYGPVGGGECLIAQSTSVPEAAVQVKLYNDLNMSNLLVVLGGKGGAGVTTGGSTRDFFAPIIYTVRLATSSLASPSNTTLSVGMPSVYIERTSTNYNALGVEGQFISTGLVACLAGSYISAQLQNSSHGGGQLSGVAVNFSGDYWYAICTDPQMTTAGSGMGFTGPSVSWPLVGLSPLAGSLDDIENGSPKILDKLRVYISANTSTTPRYLVLRVDDVDSSLMVTIPGLAIGEFEDTLNSVEACSTQLLHYTSFSTGDSTGTAYASLIQVRGFGGHPWLGSHRWGTGTLSTSTGGFGGLVSISQSTAGSCNEYHRVPLGVDRTFHSIRLRNTGMAAGTFVTATLLKDGEPTALTITSTSFGNKSFLAEVAVGSTEKLHFAVSGNTTNREFSLFVG